MVIDIVIHVLLVIFHISPQSYPHPDDKLHNILAQWLSFITHNYDCIMYK